MHEPTAELVTAEELGRRWDMSRSTVYGLIDKGLPTLKIGRLRRINPDEALAWLRASGGEAQEAPHGGR